MILLQFKTEVENIRYSNIATCQPYDIGNGNDLPNGDKIAALSETQSPISQTRLQNESCDIDQLNFKRLC